MRVTGLGSLRAYWEAVRPPGDLPRRSQIDPRGIESALDIAFLAERVAPGIARFRLAGQRIDALMGMSVRGMPLSALIEPDARAAFGEALERCFAGPAIVEMALRGANGLGLPRLEARLLLLPLRTEDGRVSRALGGFASEGRIGATPRRFDLVAVEASPVFPAESTFDGAEARQPLHGFAEDRAAYAPRPRGRPRLRVIRNDD